MIDQENGRAEIGYDLGRNHWGKGFASEAVKKLIDYGFTSLNLNRIEAKKIMETLYTERLTLRKMELEDADVLCQYWSDPEVTKYMNIAPFTDVSQARDMIQMINDLSLEGQANRLCCSYSR
ncbi:N-acetyltransferase [Bacillus licheniformis]|nr:N-acetyltransferase [Bacillus licheniformis]